MSFNLAEVHEAVAAAVADRECIVWRERRLTYTEVTDRTRRLANLLHGAGLGAHTERAQLAGHQSGQDHLGLYLYNGNEYLEGMLGSYKARVAPFNVNYRYVEEELRYLLADAGAKALIYHSAFAPTLAKVLDELPDLRVLLQVADGSGHDLLDGAVDYESALAGASPEPLPPAEVAPSPDDLYILYTGGTTGMPKGVLWRQEDIFIAAMGGRAFGQTDAYQSIDQVVEAAKNGGIKMMSAAPLMHGAAQWGAFTAFTGGNTVVMASHPERLDPADVLSIVEREKVLTVLIVGDAYGRPIADELDRGDYDLSGVLAVVSGGAALGTTLKERLLEHLPNGIVLDAVGSSETGAQMGHTSTKGAVATGRFTPGVDTVVVSEDLTHVLEPGHDGAGWLAQRGHVPLGYLGDADKTARTFPTIDGTRYSVPGDRARVLEDGSLELLGRDSVTINSGGEKIFAEEVEQAIAHHPDVYDVIVVGRPSERWGQEVVALVQPAAGANLADEALLAECEKHVARYKLPKAFVYLPQLQRSPAGKADYRWAKQQALAAATR